MLTGCDIVDSCLGRESAAQDFRVQRWRAGLAVRSEPAGADLSGKRDHEAISVQRRIIRWKTRRRSTAKDFKLEIGGLVDNKKSWTLEELYALPQEKQITRHICVEGWSAIGSWTGVRLSEFLRRIGADTKAKYVWFQCAEGYSNTIDMASGVASADAAHLQVRRRDPAASLRLPDEMSGSRPSSASRIRNTSWRCMSPTRTSAAIGKIRAITGSAGCSAARYHRHALLRWFLRTSSACTR